MHREFALSHLLNLGKKPELNTIKISRREIKSLTAMKQHYNIHCDFDSNL